MDTTKKSTEEYFALIDPPRAPKEAGNPYNFEWSGKFRDGIELRVDGTKAEFWSTSSKTTLLTAEYADPIWPPTGQAERSDLKGYLPSLYE